MEGAGAVEDNDDAFVRAALHALDDQQQTLLDVARLLPAMRVLVDEKASAQQRSTAAAGAKAWLDEYESKQRIRGTAVEPDKAGYLRKVAQSGLATATRWVVLEGRNLSYFVDRAETDLRGVLRLPGTVCERCRGMGSRRNSFRLSAAPGTAAAGSDAGALNPLNSGKRAYVFAADSSEEADDGDEEPDEEGEVDGAAGAEDQDSAGSDGGDDLDGDSAGESEAATVASRLRGTARADAKLTSFVANVLACSCRTAAGGDAYEALELALRCPSTAVIVPQGGIAAPVVLTVASSLARYTAPPVRVMPLGAVPSHAAAGAAAGGRAAELVIPTPPLSEAERETAKRARAPPPPPGHEARLRSNGVQNPGGRPVFVVADTTLFYRVRALDGRGDVVPDKEDDDAEAVAPLPEGFGFPAGACECASSPTAKADSALLAASGVASFSDDESDAGPSEADDTRGEGAAEPGREAGALGTGRPRGQALEELEWQRGDIAFVAAHFRRVFPFGSRPGKGTVRVFATCRPGGTGAIGGDGSAGGGGDK